MIVRDGMVVHRTEFLEAKFNFEMMSDYCRVNFLLLARRSFCKLSFSFKKNPKAYKKLSASKLVTESDTKFSLNTGGVDGEFQDLPFLDCILKSFLLYW